MKSFKLGLAAALMTGMMTIAPAPAMANTCEPLDCVCAVKSITAELLELNALVLVKSLTLSQIDVVNIEKTLTAGQITLVKNSLNGVLVQAQVLTLQNTLNGLTIVDVGNGNKILNISDVLSKNNLVLKDVIAINVLDNGDVILFGCKSCHK